MTDALETPYMLGQRSAHDDANGDSTSCPFEWGTEEFGQYMAGRKAYNQLCGL